MSRTSAVLRRGARPLVVIVTALSALSASALAYGEGVDISHWQGSVSWSKVRSDGVKFAFMKATEGSYYTDPTLKTNWAGTEKQGIYRGAYHFARPSVGSASAQARYYVSKVGSFRGKGDLPPVLDLEATGGLSPSQLRSWVSTWLRTTEKLTGRTPILYCSPYFWIDHLGNSTAFARYPLWIAHYTTGSPKIPGGWRTWTFWQRTSSGSVPGISGHVDMNRFNGTTAQLAALAHSTGGSGAPAPSGPTLPVGAATSLTSTPSATSVAIDKTVPFSGMLRTTSPVSPVAGRTASLWSRHVGSTTWWHKGDVVTDRTGHYRLDARVRTSADYQMRWAGASAYAASASPLMRMTTPPKTRLAVDLHKVQHTVRAGKSLTLYGHVTAGNAGVAGRTVSYYKRFPGAASWTLVGRSHSLAPTGWHQLVVHPRVTREWKVVANSSDVYTRATSGYLTVRPR